MSNSRGEFERETVRPAVVHEEAEVATRRSPTNAAAEALALKVRAQRGRAEDGSPGRFEKALHLGGLDQPLPAIHGVKAPPPAQLSHVGPELFDRWGNLQIALALDGHSRKVSLLVFDALRDSAALVEHAVPTGHLAAILHASDYNDYIKHSAGR